MSLLIPVGIIVFGSLITLASISMPLFYLQLAYAAAGFGIIGILGLRDWSAIFRARWFAWAVYILTIALLVIVLLKAPVIRNTKSWLVLGSFQFQPVELAKVALILVFAHFWSRRHIAIGRLPNLLLSLLIFVIPAALVLLQPDLGSASILFGIWFGFLLISRLPKKWLLSGAFIFAVLAVLGWNFFLEPYQKERIAAVFYPERNALGINYSTIQSKIAIGSSGFFGKGFRQGTQTQLGFLTEPGTDFIFAALTEEWGALGALIVLGAFLVLALRVLKIGIAQQSNFEHFLVLGVAIVFGLQFLVNAGSATGIFPVVGVTFPFLSYGGSSLLINFCLLGLVYAASKRA